MKKAITLTAVAFLCFGLFARAKSVGKPEASGIMIVSAFGFRILGDGVSTTFTITPTRVPQIGSGITTSEVPRLPLVGIIEGSETCPFGHFTGTGSGRCLTITFDKPSSYGCSWFMQCLIVTSATMTF